MGIIVLRATIGLSLGLAACSGQVNPGKGANGPLPIAGAQPQPSQSNASASSPGGSEFRPAEFPVNVAGTNLWSCAPYDTVLGDSSTQIGCFFTDNDKKASLEKFDVKEVALLTNDGKSVSPTSAYSRYLPGGGTLSVFSVETELLASVKSFQALNQDKSGRKLLADFSVSRAIYEQSVAFRGQFSSVMKSDVPESQTVLLKDLFELGPLTKENPPLRLIGPDGSDLFRYDGPKPKNLEVPLNGFFCAPGNIVIGYTITTPLIGMLEDGGLDGGAAASLTGSFGDLVKSLKGTGIVSVFKSAFPSYVPIYVVYGCAPPEQKDILKNEEPTRRFDVCMTDEVMTGMREMYGKLEIQCSKMNTEKYFKSQPSKAWYFPAVSGSDSASNDSFMLQVLSAKDLLLPEQNSDFNEKSKALTSTFESLSAKTLTGFWTCGDKGLLSGAVPLEPQKIYPSLLGVKDMMVPMRLYSSQCSMVSQKIAK